MVAKEFNLEAIRENGAWQEFDDDAEETLSFSDLPLYSNFSFENTSDDCCKETDQDNFFEFFSEDFTAYHPKSHIIFCGKLISTSDKSKTQPRIPKKSHSFAWNSSSSFKIPKQEKCFKTCKSLPVIQDRHCSKSEFPRNKAKSRWYSFGRFPMKMELRDMKTRQSRRKPSTMFQFGNKTEMVKNDKTRRLKRLWGLLRLKFFG